LKTSDKHIKHERNDKLKSALFTALTSGLFFLFIYYFSVEIEVPKAEIKKPVTQRAEVNTEGPVSQDAGTPIDSILKQDIYVPEVVASTAPAEKPVEKAEPKTVVEQPKKHHKKHKIVEEKQVVAKTYEKKPEVSKSTKKHRDADVSSAKSSKNTTAKTAEKESKKSAATSKSLKDKKAEPAKSSKGSDTKSNTKESKTTEKSTSKKTKKVTVE
jgi:hypothetical protein